MGPECGRNKVGIYKLAEDGHVSLSHLSVWYGAGEGSSLCEVRSSGCVSAVLHLFGV